MALVYLATNRVNGKQYVGFTGQTLRQRMKAHKAQAKKGAGCRVFGAAIRKHGWDVFEWEVLFESAWNEALEAERYFIWRLRPAYNLTSGGEVPEFSAESRARLSQSLSTSLRVLETNRRMAAERKGKSRPAEAMAGVRSWGESVEGRLFVSKMFKGVPKPRAAVEKAAAGRRTLTPAQAVNVRFLRVFGAEQREACLWFGVNQTTISNVGLGKRGWAKVLAEFYCESSRSLRVP